MKFVDEIVLYACSGEGGDGVVRWATSRGKPKGGPAGGDGGRGGDVYIEGVRNISLLSKYRSKNKFLASRGGDGAGDSLHGKNGKDVTIKLPVGSVVRVVSTGEEAELIKEGERIMLLRGGRGGYGNEHFKSSRNVTPQEHTDGKSGLCSDLKVELKLIAEVGLIGFPNAGKSSLLNSLTRARVKTGNYEFTTLDPNLGVLYGHILADIPGLIEGASKGKGLGDKFLRHVMRTNILVHCISVERDDIEKAYKAIRTELGLFDVELLKKKEIILLTKTDLITEYELKKKQQEAEKLSDLVLPVSIFNEKSIKSLGDTLLNLV